MNKLNHIYLFLGLLFLAGCHSVPAPPGFVGGGTGTAGRIELPGTLSLPAQYSLLVCYIDREGEDAARWAAATLAVAKNACGVLQNKIRAELFAPLREKYSDVLELSEEGQVSWRQGAFAERTDWEALEVMFSEVEVFLKTQGRLRVPVGEIQSYLSARKDVVQWKMVEEWFADGHSEVVLDGADNGLALLELCRLREASRKKRELLDIEARAKTMMQDGDGVQALELLNNALRGIGSDNSPEVLGDNELRARLVAMCRQLPELVISWELKELGAVASPEWRGGELRLAEDLTEWRADGRFTVALEENETAIRQQAERFLRERLASQDQELTQAISGRAFLPALRKLLKEEKGNEDDIYFSCYEDNITKELGIELLEAQRLSRERLCRAAAEWCLAGQQVAFEVEKQYGQVLAYHCYLAELTALDPSLEILRDASKISAERVALVTETLLRKDFDIFLEVKEFVAGMPGLGVAWQHDLGNLLQKEWPLFFAGKKLRARGQEERPAGLCLANGVVSDYSSGEIAENSSRRVFRGVSAAHKEWLDGREAFVQELYDQEIVAHTREREAHIRLTCDILLNENRLRNMEITEFLRRTFVAEETVESKAVGRHVVFSEQELLPIASPTLRLERLQSTGELLDEARRRVLAQVWLQLLDALAQEWLQRYRVAKNHLDKAGSQEEYLDALEKLGELYPVIGSGGLPTLGADLVRLPATPSEGHLASWQELLAHWKELSELPLQADLVKCLEVLPEIKN